MHWSERHQTFEEYLKVTGEVYEYWRKLGASTRVRNCMIHLGIYSLEELRQSRNINWHGMPNVGKITLDEINALAGLPIVELGDADYAMKKFEEAVNKLGDNAISEKAKMVIDSYWKGRK